MNIMSSKQESRSLHKKKKTGGDVFKLFSQNIVNQQLTILKLLICCQPTNKNRMSFTK
jgi:hypothetical protein